MQTAQIGDHVQVHYVKRYQDGLILSSRAKSPVDVIVGENHPRLPGLGTALVGLSPGAKTTMQLTPEHVYDPSRVRRVRRQRFPSNQALGIGKWLRLPTTSGRPRLVRILEIREQVVVVDANHRGAGQSVELEIELICIQGAAGEGGSEVQVK